MSALKNGIEVSDEDPSEIFEILAKLGEGSYGSVFKALDKRDNKIVAIKVLEVESEDAGDLRREVNFLKTCKSEFIVAYRGSFQKDNHIWIVMEYCGAGSVCDLMAICERTLTEDQIAAVVRMTLQGLSYLHSARKIHRDIKAGNILLTHAGDCKLADFGVSAELTDRTLKRKTVIGTPYWMAPEVLQSAEYDGKADVWSLGITCIEMAVGEPPHANVHPMRAIFLIPTSDPPTLPNPEAFSDEFNDFIRVCLQKDPSRRPTADGLMSHAFVRKGKGKAVVAALVEECMQEIDDFRAREAQEAEEKEKEEAAAAVAAGNSNNGGAAMTGTMVNGGAAAGAGAAGDESGKAAAGAGGGGGGGAEDGEAPEEHTASDTGTMLFNSKGAEPPDFSAGGTMIAKKRDDKKAPKLLLKKADDDDRAQWGTMLATNKKAQPADVRGHESKEKDDGVTHFYKTGKGLDVTERSPVADLKKALSTLERAFEKEKKEMEAFYAEKRKTLEHFLQKKNEI